MTDTTAARYVILTAIEFDDTVARALREACRIAQHDATAELHLIHAIAPSLVPERDGESTAIAAQLARAPGKLREFVDNICAGTTLKIVAHVRSGNPAQVILQTGADLNTDLIVVGTHQRSGLGKLVLGSVGERVLREAHCPVLIAAPKSHSLNSSIEPPCPIACGLGTSTDPHAWCDRHRAPGSGRTCIRLPTGRLLRPWAHDQDHRTHCQLHD
jgi:nucleotide-binding universal stress UspA family protein